MKIDISYFLMVWLVADAAAPRRVSTAAKHGNTPGTSDDASSPTAASLQPHEAGWHATAVQQAACGQQTTTATVQEWCQRVNT